MALTKKDVQCILIVVVSISCALSIISCGIYFWTDSELAKSFGQFITFVWGASFLSWMGTEWKWWRADDC